MTSINYSKVVQALIARFDPQVSVQEHADLRTLLNWEERNLYFYLQYEMGRDKNDVIITTARSRKIQEQKHEIGKLFKD